MERVMDFDEIIGNKRLIEGLQNAIKTNSISHSYLFNGDHGVGKLTVALSFAKTLLCKKEGIDACNECSSCLKFDTGNHPDFTLIRSDKKSIKKEQMENLIESTSTSPFESKRKIFIIDNSDRITPEGQNSILKTLEEPPEFLNIILISSKREGMLSTILSRCQEIKFYPVDGEKIKKLLVEKYGKSPEEAQLISLLANKSVAKSIDLAKSDEFLEKRNYIIKIIDDIIKGNRTRALNTIDFFLENKEDIDEILDIILYWFRDLIIYKETGSQELIINRDKIDLLESQTFMDWKLISRIIDRIEKTKRDIKRNINFRLSIEVMLLSIEGEQNR